MQTVKFEDWLKLDLRVGKIRKVEDIAGADKLYKLEVDLGEEKRILVAGLKGHYKKEELEGKSCIVFCNLEPKKLKGIESQGMILAAVSDDEKTIGLIEPDKEMTPGSKVR